MQATFRFRTVVPTPLAPLAGLRALLATNGIIAFGDERVKGQMMIADEGIALLKEGGKAKLELPYHLAYGEGGSGPIPPKADLVFDVWLVKVN